jgi:protease I
MSKLTGLRVAVLATDGFEESELTEPVKVLSDAGAQVTVLSLNSGEIQAVRHDLDKTVKVKVDRLIKDASADEFDAVHLPGGAVNADTLRMVPEVQAFLRAMQDASKPISVICHAAWELVSAGLVRGRTLTSYHTIQDDIRNAGGRWMDQEVVEDGNWVTSRQPSDLPAFNRAMITLFSRGRASASLREMSQTRAQA